MYLELRPIQTLTAFDALTLTGALASSGKRPPVAEVVKIKAGGRRSSLRPARCKRTKDVTFAISQDLDKGFHATCLTEHVSTEAQTWEELRANIRLAVRGFSFDRYRPNRIQVHIVRDEMLVLK